jgi:ribosomal protein L37E
MTDPIYKRRHINGKYDPATHPLAGLYCEVCGRQTFKLDEEICRICGGRLFWWSSRRNAHKESSNGVSADTR